MRLGPGDFKYDRNFSKKCFRVLDFVIRRNMEDQAVRTGHDLSVFRHERGAAAARIREAVSQQLPLFPRENLEGNFDTDGGSAA